MNALPAELRTPPLPLLAFIGCPEVHKEVGISINQFVHPPFFPIGLTEPSESLLNRVFGVIRKPKPYSTPDGILKADWFLKQRQRRPAVAVAFVNRSDVVGDPSSWLRMLSGLRLIRSMSAHKGVRLVVVVLQQQGPLTDLPPDRVAGICSNLDLDQSHLLLLSRQLFDPPLPAEQRPQLQAAQVRPLGDVLKAAAKGYYTAAAERLLLKQAEVSAAVGSCPPEITAAINFKLAVLAEFRQDWLAAVSCYQAAAAALQQVPLGRPTVSCQRHAEVAAVAEVVQFKAMMLLLHQQRYAEAVQQLRSHLAALGPLPAGLPLAASAAHYGWLARQYHCAAQMIAGSRMDEATLQSHPDAAPTCLLMSAVQAALSRKALAEQISSTQRDKMPSFDVSLVQKGRYLGQVVVRSHAADGGLLSGHSDLTDAQYCEYLEAEESKVDHRQQVMNLLLEAQATINKQHSGLTAAAGTAAAPAPGPAGRAAAAHRMQARLAWLLAEQYAETSNLTAARKLLLYAVYVYRRDGWDLLLLHCLLLLQRVTQRLKLHKESLLHSLEIACLAHSLAAQPSGNSSGGSNGGSNSSSHSSRAATVKADSHGHGLEWLADGQQPAALASAAVQGMLSGAADQKAGIMKAANHQPQQQPAADGDNTSSPPVAGSPAAAKQSLGAGGGFTYVVQQLDLAAAMLQQQQQQQPGQDPLGASAHGADLLLQYQQQDFGWWRILEVSGGFMPAGPDPTRLTLCLALYSQLPVPLTLTSASVTLTDSQGSWTAALAVGGPTNQQQQQQQQTNPTPAAVAELTPRLGKQHLVDQQQEQQQHHLMGHATAVSSSGCWPLQLQSGSWQQLHVTIPARCVGSVGVELLHLQLSDRCSVDFRVGSFPAGRAVLGRVVGPGGGDPFKVWQGVKLGSWASKVHHVGSLPLVKVVAPDLMLAGEFVPVQVQVQASTAQPAASLEVSVRSAVGSSPAAVTLLAQSAEGKVHQLTTEGHILPVPALAAGGSFSQLLWLRSALADSCRVVAVLACPTLVPASAELSFSQAFLHISRLSSEMNVHTLVIASPAYSAVNTGHPEAAAARGDESTALAIGAAGGGGGGQFGVPLAVGQMVFCHVLVQAPNNVDLLLLDADLVLDEKSGMQVINTLGDQLQGKPLPAGHGSVHCLLLQLMPLTPTPAGTCPSSLGHLNLRWRRRQPAIADANSSFGDVKPAVAAVSEDVTTQLELPAVVIQEGLLSVRVVAPHHATAGVAFPYTLQLHNLTGQPQEVLLSVQEAQSVVYSGDKQQTVTCLPRDTHSITWTLVAHAPGQVPLPVVKVASARFHAQAVTQNCSIQVMPF